MGNEDKHIDFSSWEPGEPLDEEHLAVCAGCREDQQAALFIRRQAAEVPRIEAPPFFAPRVARLALEQEQEPLFELIQLAARRLLPVFMALVLIVVSLAYWNREAASTSQLGEEDYEVWALLLQEEAAPQQLTLDDVFDILAEDPEGGSLDRSK